VSLPRGSVFVSKTWLTRNERYRSFAEIIESNKRSFLFRDVAIEFFFADKRNFLCVFRSQKERRAALRQLSSKNDPNAIKQSALGNLILDTVAKAIDKNSLELEGYTRQWQSRRLSNASLAIKYFFHLTVSLIHEALTVCILTDLEPVREPHSKW
jgi:hypothetical protein